MTGQENKNTLGEKLHDFFMVSPTGKNLGLPQKEKMSKEEALKAIEERWEHPFHPENKHESGGQAPNKDEESNKTLGQKLHDFFFVAPTGKDLGLPQTDQMSKEEALKAIEEHWEHPFQR